MRKEAEKIIEKKTSLPEVMKKYGAYFSLEVSEGYAHIKIEEDGKMYVEWLTDEGYMVEGETRTPFEDIEIVANFMREMKDLKLTDYSK
jgi:hypothetical protein